MSASQAPCCPVCSATFRESDRCSRCGADLRPLMTLVARSWSLRQRCRDAIRAGRYALAVQFAQAANEAHATRASRRLCRLARSMAERADFGIA